MARPLSSLATLAAATLCAASVALAQPPAPPPLSPQPPAQPPPKVEPPEAPAAPAPATEPTARGPGEHLPWARIEQVRRGNRVSEINVSSGAGEHRYTIVNREGRLPLSPQELSSGLSTPSFFKIEF